MVSGKPADDWDKYDWDEEKSDVASESWGTSEGYPMFSESQRLALGLERKQPRMKEQLKANGKVDTGGSVDRWREGVRGAEGI